jgi:hypothetical protein
MSLKKKDRKFQSKRGNSFPIDSDRQGGQTFAMAMAAALIGAFQDRCSPLMGPAPRLPGGVGQRDGMDGQSWAGGTSGSADGEWEPG